MPRTSNIQYWFWLVLWYVLLCPSPKPKNDAAKHNIACWWDHRWVYFDVSGSCYWMSGMFCSRCGKEQNGDRNWFDLWGRDRFPAKVYDSRVGRMIGRMPWAYKTDVENK